MHTIQQVPEPRWPRRYPLPWRATYSDGDYIYGGCLAADPITAYHGAVLAALKTHQQNLRLRSEAH